jgi:hypothetical protein
VHAAVLAAGMLVARRFRLDTAQALDHAPIPLQAPDVRLSPGHQDGPILVRVLYLVPPAEAAAFVLAMEKVERHRRRTGAYRWELHRSLTEPERFEETYYLRTWGEHLRQQERLTAATEPVLAGVRPYRVPGPSARLIAAQSHLHESVPTAVDPVEPLA